MHPGSATSLSAESGFELDLEIALGGVSAPNAFGVETPGDVIEALLAIRKNDVELYFPYLEHRGLLGWHGHEARGSRELTRIKTSV